jgi:hypothetical protein
VLFRASSFYSDSTLAPSSPEVPNHRVPPLTPVVAGAPDKDHDTESAAVALGACATTTMPDLSLRAITASDLGHETKMLGHEAMCCGC